MSSNTVKLSLFSLPEHVLRHRHSAFSYTALLPGTREAFV